MKRPEELVTDRGRLKVSVTFRLSEADATALHALAESVGVGHATLARRIVEEYVRINPVKSGTTKRR
jgi:hypothetical protein